MNITRPIHVGQMESEFSILKANLNGFARFVAGVAENKLAGPWC